MGNASSIVTNTSPLKLVQALNDEDSRSVSELIKSKNVKIWIDNKVAVKQIKYPQQIIPVDYEYTTCLTFACWCSDIRTVRQLVGAGADVTVTVRTHIHRFTQLVEVELML